VERKRSGVIRLTAALCDPTCTDTRCKQKASERGGKDRPEKNSKPKGIVRRRGIQETEAVARLQKAILFDRKRLELWLEQEGSGEDKSNSTCLEKTRERRDGGSRDPEGILISRKQPKGSAHENGELFQKRLFELPYPCSSHCCADLAWVRTDQGRRRERGVPSNGRVKLGGLQSSLL